MNTRIDVIMLGFFLDDKSVGIYSFAAFFAEGFLQLIIVIQNNLNPKIALLSGKNSLKELNLFLIKVRNISYKFISPSGILIFTIYCSQLQLF